MMSTDIQVQSSMNVFEKKAILILVYNFREDKLLPVIPDTELDGFEREGGGRGVDTHVLYTWAKQKYYE